MKRILAMVLATMMIFSLTACGSRNASSESTTEDSTVTDRTDATVTDQSGEDAESNILVAYFSLAGEQYEVGEITKGNTQIVAEMIAEETGADLFAIEPVKEYPDDYDGKLEEATSERENNERPEIENQVENFDDYDTIFIGYPIWWGDMPMIMYTFLESYDFSGKTVIPFNTHAGSGQAGTQNEIESLLTDANVLNGLAIRGRTAQEDPDSAREDIQNWLDELEY